MSNRTAAIVGASAVAAVAVYLVARRHFAAATEDDDEVLRQGTWATDRKGYGIGKGRGMAFRRTFMPMDGPRWILTGVASQLIGPNNVCMRVGK